MEKYAAPAKLISQRLSEFANGFWIQVPNLVGAILFLLLVFFLATVAMRMIIRLSERRRRPDLGALLGSLARGAIMVAAFLFSLAIVFPSVKPSDVFATLGIGSVAIGFAFKDILQNLLAGLLLLIQRPYRRGDEIKVKDFEGTVRRIETRATIIRTFDGRRVIIPNSDAYTSAVIINTAREMRRQDYVVGIGYGDSIDQAVKVFTDAMRSVDGVLDTPAPEVLPWELAASTVNLKLRWWARSSQREQTLTRAGVIRAVFLAASESGIDLPFDTQVLLLHDQTETTDGIRGEQREGWPRRPGKPPSRSARTKPAGAGRQPPAV